MSVDTTRSPGRAASARLRAALLESQRRVLERIASGAPLEEILETLVLLVEEQAGGMRCAVLLADAGQERLRFAAAPHVPKDFKQSIEPFLRIAPGMAPCGTAAYLRQPVYTRDTATDPLWENRRDIAERSGLRAIWSTPILADDNRVLGTFAMAYGEPRLPAEEHIQLIDMATQMARVAIEARCDSDLLSVVFDSAPNGILIMDLAGNILMVNHAFADALGYTTAELQGKDIAAITEAGGHPALAQDLLSSQEEVASHRRYRGRAGAILSSRERSTLRRDRAGEARYVVTNIEKMIEARSDSQGRLSRRERQVLELVVEGRTSKDIAACLGIAATSVDSYRSRIMLKLGINDLPGLVRFAIRQGIATV